MAQMSNTTPEINVGALSEALNDKADLDMDNIPPATLSAKIAPLLESLGGNGLEVAEFSDTEAGWYILFSNGLLIQNITQHPALPKADSNFNVTYVTISLLTPYKDTRYMIQPALSPAIDATMMYTVLAQPVSGSNIRLGVQAVVAAPANSLNIFCIGLAEVPQD